MLRELEGEERGSVDPATMVRIFHGDRDLVLAASRWALVPIRPLGRASAQGRQGGQGDATPRLCRAQQRYYHELRGRIRQALRSVVQARRKPERAAQLSLFAEDEASA